MASASAQVNGARNGSAIKMERTTAPVVMRKRAIEVTRSRVHQVKLSLLFDSVSTNPNRAISAQCSRRSNFRELWTST